MNIDGKPEHTMQEVMQAHVAKIGDFPGLGTESKKPLDAEAPATIPNLEQIKEFCHDTGSNFHISMSRNNTEVVIYNPALDSRVSLCDSRLQPSCMVADVLSRMQKVFEDMKAEAAELIAKNAFNNLERVGLHAVGSKEGEKPQ